MLVNPPPPTPPSLFLIHAIAVAPPLPPQVTTMFFYYYYMAHILDWGKKRGRCVCVFKGASAEAQLASYFRRRNT